MISKRTARHVRRAQLLISLRMADAAAETLGRLEPRQHESPPLVWLRMQAHIAADQWQQAQQLGLDLLECLHAAPGHGGPLLELALFNLSECCFQAGDRDRGHAFMEAATAVSERPLGLEMTDETARALWDLILDTRFEREGAA